MKRLLLLILGLAFCVIVDGKDGLEHIAKGKILQKDYCTVVEYSNEYDLLFVNVVIRNNTYRFMVDTGAPCAVSEKLYHQLNLPILGSHTVFDQSGLKDSMLFVNLDHLKLGDIDFLNSMAIVIKDTLLSSCFKVDGIIGSSMLRNSIVQISPTEQTITITNDKKRLQLNKKHASKLKINKQASPYVWLNLGGKLRDLVLFDTGYSGGMYDISLHAISYCLSKNKTTGFNILAHDYGSTNSIGLHGVAKDTIQYVLSVPEMKLNNTVFRNAVLYSTSGMSKIGTGFLQYGTITIDYIHKRFYFDTNLNSYQLAEKVLGFTPVLMDGALRVGPIWDKDLLPLITSGEEILKMNNEDLEGINVCDLLNAPNLEDTVHLVLRNADGAIKEVSIEKKYYNP